FVEGAQIVVLAEQLTVLERRQARIEHDVGLEIEDPLEVLQRHVEQKADPRGQRLQKPDVGDRGGERDVAHALAAHARQRHLDAALLADDALVLHALVLATQALVVLDRPEDAGAEQAVALGLERAIVDRLRLLDLAERPRKDLLGARDGDLDLIERLRSRDRRERIGDFLVHSRLPRGSASATPTSLSWKKAAARSPRANSWGGARLARARIPYSAASAGGVSSGSRFSDANSTLRPSERISLTSTLKLSGMPDSNVSSPRTIAS